MRPLVPVREPVAVERAVGVPRRARERAAPREARERGVDLRALFREFDANGDGVVSFDECEGAMGRVAEAGAIQPLVSALGCDSAAVQRRRALRAQHAAQRASQRRAKGAATEKRLRIRRQFAAAGEIVVWPHVADFRRIRQELLRRGLFETSMGYYAKMAAWHVFMWLGALYLSLRGASCAMRMAGATAMGVFWQQSVGIGHDLGHSGVTHSFYKDHAIGSLLSAFMGLSVGWWKSDHNTHHVVCNAIEHDPNVQHMPMLAITSKIFARARFWDTYHLSLIHI